MNNEEKKQFLIDAHTLFMNFRPYDVKSLEETKKKEGEFWSVYYSKFKDLIPKTLYKYRKINNKSILNLINDEVWFSHPKDFDDSIDSTINNDDKEELKPFLEDSTKVVNELSKDFIIHYNKQFNEDIDIDIIDSILSLLNEDGTINEEETIEYLKKYYPEYANQDSIEYLKEYLKGLDYDGINKAFSNELAYFFGMNKRIREKALTYCLAEEADNDVLWAEFTDGSRGFCIEYSFDISSILGQKMILNLFPVYYGEKELSRYFDVLSRGIRSNDSINGISKEDYLTWFVSVNTKGKKYEYQKEWRITFNDEMGGNLQKFPFVKSIILGERIAKHNEARLVKIAKEKGIELYKRKYNSTSSKIVMEKLF